MTHDAAFACDAPAGFAVVEAAAPLPDALGLLPLVDVPLGLPEMFCCEMAMPVLLWQWLPASKPETEVRRVTSAHCRIC
jgi:hypothetical protein